MPQKLLSGEGEKRFRCLVTLEGKEEDNNGFAYILGKERLALGQQVTLALRFVE